MKYASRRIVALVGMTVTLAAVSAASAQAKAVTGEQSTITPSLGVTHFFAAHHITVSPVGPATISGGSLTLPIVGGTVKVSQRTGRLIMAGGLRLTRNGQSITLRAFVATRDGSKNAVTAKVGQVRFTVAHATGVHVAISGKTGTITGELKLSAVAARAINQLAGHQVVSPGANLGSFTSSVTVG
jgi:hypothetical protein